MPHSTAVPLAMFPVSRSRLLPWRRQICHYVLYCCCLPVWFCLEPRLNDAVIRRGSAGSAAAPPGAYPGGPAGPNGYGGTPAKRKSGSGVLSSIPSNNDVDGAYVQFAVRSACRVKFSFSRGIDDRRSGSASYIRVSFTPLSKL